MFFNILFMFVFLFCVFVFYLVYFVFCIVLCTFSPFVHLSIKPHGTTRLPLHQFSPNFIFEHFPKSIEKIEVSLKSDKKNCYFA